MRTNIPPTVTARPNLNSFAARRGPRNAVAAYDRRSSESGSVLHASDSESEFCIVDRQMQCKPECGHPAVNLHGLSLSRFSESVSIPGCQPANGVPHRDAQSGCGRDSDHVSAAGSVTGGPESALA